MYFGFLKTATASPSLKVGDPGYNAEEMIEAYQVAKKAEVGLLVFPELSVTGYSCGELFRQRALIDGALKALAKIKDATKDSDMLITVGLPLLVNGKLYDCAAVICGGKILGIVPKTNVCCHGDIYDSRYFSPAPKGEASEIQLLGESVPFGKELVFKCAETPELVIGVEIGDDLFGIDQPSQMLVKNGASVICNLSASSDCIGKDEYTKKTVEIQSGRLICSYVYAGCSDGESGTDSVYSGYSLIAENGKVLAASPPYSYFMTCSDIDIERITHDRMKNGGFSPEVSYREVYFCQKQESFALSRAIYKAPFLPKDPAQIPRRCETILDMQVSGLKKRVSHIGCQKIVVGISGGLDSCLALLVMALAMDKLDRPRGDVIAITMPCFGTTKRTKSNAQKLCEALGVTLKEINISKAVLQHFEDIGQDKEAYDVTYENCQARERTQVLMDVANKCGGIVVGTGDLSELALGWATYNGDHMSMYGVNAGVPKTLIRYIVRYYADNCGRDELAQPLYDILDTPVSPELIPPKDGEISQVTEDIVGPYELHDFYLYYHVRYGFTPEKILFLAKKAFSGSYDDETLVKWLKNFYRRFTTQQFKRSCLPDGAKIGSVSLSPRGDWKMPSDASFNVWNF